ncbi:hypothetical protein IU510_20620 [Nocardia cyriacigeorgica]|uniref:hypothetical protein n=1 Tax=Nocardia cyriacigeorgica TaxID=135487 RepID=UPI001893A3BF|nr:hypothetical protein [Nocardia cyriacigeorgica]MBF6100466.1 hypothetical protein [Nocardia cyriacigeorgica]
MTHTRSRSEFDLAVHLGVAGPATALAGATVDRWRELDPEWKGKHWAYSDPDGHNARYLRPTNLAARTTTDS